MSRTKMENINRTKEQKIKIKSDFSERLTQFENKMCDVILCAEMDGTRIPTHRLILSISSGYFESMFGSGMKESDEDVVEIKGISGAILRSLIHFSYTEEINFDEHNVQELAEASLLLQFNTLANYCGEIMSKKISIFNCCGLATFADQHNLETLFELSTKFIMTNFELIYKQSEFNEVPPTFLANILGRDDLIVESETIIFDAIKKWFLHDPEGRQAHLMELLKCIRFSNLTSKFTGTVLFDFCMKYKCDQLIALAVVLQQKSGDRNAQQLALRRNNNRSSKKLEKLSLIAISSTNVFHYYSPENNQWTFLEKRFNFLHPKDKIIGIGMNNTELIFVCTSSKITVIKSVDLITGAEVPHVLTPRSCEGARTLIQDDGVYIIWNKNFIKYDLRLRNWLSLPEMSVSRKRHSVVILKNYLYVLGGEDTSSVERYDFSRNFWHNCHSLTQKRCDSVATVMGGWIYIIGPSYVEQLNPTTGIWSLVYNVTPLSTVSSAIGWDDDIYLAGTDNSFQRIVVRFTPKHNEWTDMSRLKEADHQNIRLVKCNFPINTLLSE